MEKIGNKLVNKALGFSVQIMKYGTILLQGFITLIQFEAFFHEFDSSNTHLLMHEIHITYESINKDRYLSYIIHNTMYWTATQESRRLDKC